MTYRELSDTDYSDLRKTLTDEKGSGHQIEFLRALRSNAEFIGWFEDKVATEEAGTDFDLVTGNLSEHEFKEPTQEVEEELFEKWESIITPAQACRSTFWGYITLRHLKEGNIQSFYLAANGGTLPGGRERIDKALKSGQPNDVDAIVRIALRRFSGLPEARGNRTVYVDCPFARAWWRFHIARKVSDITKADFDKIVDVLRISQAYWESLVSSIVSRNSVFGDETIRAALIWALSDKKGSKSSSHFTSKGLDKIIKRIGVRIAWQELAVFSPEELKRLLEQEFLA